MSGRSRLLAFGVACAAALTGLAHYVAAEEIAPGLYRDGDLSLRAELLVDGTHLEAPEVRNLLWSPDGSAFAYKLINNTRMCAGGDTPISVYDLASRRSRGPFHHPDLPRIDSSTVTRLTWSPSGEYFSAGFMMGDHFGVLRRDGKWVYLIDQLRLRTLHRAVEDLPGDQDVWASSSDWRPGTEQFVLRTEAAYRERPGYYWLASASGVIAHLDWLHGFSWGGWSPSGRRIWMNDRAQWTLVADFEKRQMLEPPVYGQARGWLDDDALIVARYVVDHGSEYVLVDVSDGSETVVPLDGALVAWTSRGALVLRGRLELGAEQTLLLVAPLTGDEQELIRVTAAEEIPPPPDGLDARDESTALEYRHSPLGPYEMTDDGGYLVLGWDVGPYIWRGAVKILSRNGQSEVLHSGTFVHAMAWAPDGRRLLLSASGRLYLIEYPYP